VHARRRVDSGVSGATVTWRVAGECFEHAGLVAHFGIDDVDEGDFSVLAPCIVTALEAVKPARSASPISSRLDDGAAQRFSCAASAGIAQRQRQFGNPDHG
jgi:hypothetical protein